jgi:hypothetical protein
MDDAQPPRPFEHVHAPKAALYRRVMYAFVDAKRRFLVHLRPEDVADSLGLGCSAVGITRSRSRT